MASMTLRTEWAETPRLHRILLAAIMTLDAVALMVVLLATGMHYGDWWAVAALIPLLIGMGVAHVAFYRYQVRREAQRNATVKS